MEAVALIAGCAAALVVLGYQIRLDLRDIKRLLEKGKEE